MGSLLLHSPPGYKPSVTLCEHSPLLSLTKGTAALPDCEVPCQSPCKVPCSRGLCQPRHSVPQTCPRRALSELQCLPQLIKVQDRSVRQSTPYPTPEPFCQNFWAYCGPLLEFLGPLDSPPYSITITLAQSRSLLPLTELLSSRTRWHGLSLAPVIQDAPHPF